MSTSLRYFDTAVQFEEKVFGATVQADDAPPS